MSELTYISYIVEVNAVPKVIEGLVNYMQAETDKYFNLNPSAILAQEGKIVQQKAEYLKLYFTVVDEDDHIISTFKNLFKTLKKDMYKLKISYISSIGYSKDVQYDCIIEKEERDKAFTEKSSRKNFKIYSSGDMYFRKIQNESKTIQEPLDPQSHHVLLVKELLEVEEIINSRSLYDCETSVAQPITL